MPSRSKRVCSRCRRTVPPGPCANCTTESRKRGDLDRPTASQRGYDTRWQRTRREYLAAHPQCECDEHRGDRMAPLAQDVHHVDGEGPLGPRGYDWTNLLALTHACHSKVTAREQGWHAS